MKAFKHMTALVLALVMAAALAVTAYAATVTVKYREFVYSSQITFRQYDYSQSTSPTVVNMTISATSSLGSGSALYHVKYANGAVAYCIQPGVHSDDSGSYVQGSSGCWYNLPASVQSAIALALACGYPSADYGTASGDRNSSAIVNAEKWAATQAIIWELICEYRSAYTYDDWGYQIISTLPTITSKASSLSEYTYVDTMSKGIKYNMNDVVIEFFRDSACTDKITTWGEDSGKFTVSYDDTANTMTIRMTDTGLSEINEAATVYTDSVKRGYSDCTMRISYAATLTAAAKMGDTDNPNEVVLTWKRTNTTYYDTLKDCCHVYTYGIDVLKQFSDGKGNIQNVKFNLHNDTDNCYIIADLKDGTYYAKGITTKKADATTFIPNSSGHIVVKGLEDDTYSLTEIATDKGYILLKDAIKLVIKTSENGACKKCGAKLLTASATINGKDVTMTDGNAIVPLTVVNNPGFDLPKTGGYGTWMFTIGGVALLGAAAFIVIRSRKHKSEQ